MSTKATYTKEEWQLIFTSPSMVGLAVTAASPNGPFGVLKEMFSVGMAIGEVFQKGSKTELINALIADLKARGTKPERPQGISTPEQAKSAALEHLRRLAFVLNSKTTPEEAGEFKSWLMSIGQRVAEASNEGGFLGFGGERVSDAERAVLKSISETLGVSA